MSIEVNTNRNTGVRQITIKRQDGSKVGTITIHSQSLKKLKKLGYKQRRISTMITQATTSGNARQVLASAKTETVNLRRKLASTIPIKRNCTNRYFFVFVLNIVRICCVPRLM